MSSPKLFQVVHGEGRGCEVLKTTLFEEKGLCVCDSGAHLLSFSLLYLSMIPIPDSLVDWEKFDAPHRYRTSALSDSDARMSVFPPVQSLGLLELPLTSTHRRSAEVDERQRLCALFSSGEGSRGERRRVSRNREP